MATKRRPDLSVLDKLTILNDYDALPSMSQRGAAEQLKISQPVLNKILKNRTNLESASISDMNASRKRQRLGKDEDVEVALVEWFQSVREKDARVNGPILRDKAEALAKKLGKENFVATEGWFRRFTTEA